MSVSKFVTLAFSAVALAILIVMAADDQFVLPASASTIVSKPEVVFEPTKPKAVTSELENPSSQYTDLLSTDTEEESQ